MDSTPSSSQQRELKEELSPACQTRLECCECAVPVGADGPQRAALLLPCQHVLHASCVEFIKRRVKLLRSISTGNEDWMESLLATGEGTAGPLFDTTGTAFVCPGCQQAVRRIVPLFASGEAPGLSAAAAAAKEAFDATLQEQRRLLRRLRRLREQKDSVNALGNQCASLHERRASGLQEMDRYNRMFPSLSPPDSADAAGKQKNNTAAAYQRMGVAPMSSLEQMSTTELELYLAEMAPLLVSTQTSLRNERRAVEKRRVRLESAKKRYHTMKEIAQLDREIAQARQGHHAEGQQPAERLQAPRAGELERRRRQLEREVSLSAPGTVVLPQDTPPRQKRRREPAVINVDYAPRTGASGRHATSADAVVAACVEDVDRYDVDDAEEPADLVSSRIEMIVDSDSDEESAPTEFATTAAFEDNNLTTFSADVNRTRSHVSLEDSHDVMEGDGDIADSELLPPSLVRHSRSGAAAPLKIHSNHIRMLPRMEERLWQPSLRF